jgi:hypothetical protein
VTDICSSAYGNQPACHLYNLAGLGFVKYTSPFVFAGFADAQQNKVFPQALRRTCAADDIPQSCERFDRMFGVVVVPGYAIVIEECEQSISIFFEAAKIPKRDICPESARKKCFVKPPHCWLISA